jgi:fumarylacetoacetase
MGLKSFVEISEGSHFPLENLPFGVFRPKPPAEGANVARPAVAIGDYVLDLSVVAGAGLFDGPHLKGSTCFSEVPFAL